MDADQMAKNINSRLKNYMNHKVKVLKEKVYWTIVDKIFEAENYDDYDMDENGNIHICYNLKKEESIVSQHHDIVCAEIINEYRKKIKEKLVKDGFYVKFDGNDLYVYFCEPNNSSETSSIDSDNSSSSKDFDKNFNVYKMDREFNDSNINYWIERDKKESNNNVNNNVENEEDNDEDKKEKENNINEVDVVEAVLIDDKNA